MRKYCYSFLMHALVLLTMQLTMPVITSNAQDFEWAHLIGGKGRDLAYGVAADSKGNVYVTGIYDQPINFDPDSSSSALLTPVGSSDVFIAKYDKDGKYIWAVSIGGSDYKESSSIVIDKDDNIYISGAFRGAADFDPGAGNAILETVGGNQDAFIAKYNANGKYLWAKRIGSHNYTDYAFDVAVDREGHVFLTGTFEGSVNVDSGGSNTTFTSPAGFANGFLIKYDKDGNYLWAKNMGINGIGSSFRTMMSVTTDIKGSVYVAGSFQNTFNTGINGGTLSSAGDYDGFLLKCDAEGKYLWAKRMGGGAFDYMRDVQVYGGNVYITGSFNGMADFNSGQGSLTAVGGDDIFLAKYDTTGSYIWAKGIGGNLYDAGAGLALDSVGNIYMTGVFEGIVDFDPGTSAGVITPQRGGGWDIFVAKYNPGGEYLWATSIEGTGAYETSLGIALYGGGNVYVTGYVNSPQIHFTPGSTAGTHNRIGRDDAFVVKYNCSDTSIISMSAKECGDSYRLNEEVYTASGNYMQHFFNTAGCDSVIKLDLTLYPFEQPSITINGFELGVTGTYATYQWVKDGEDIPGATHATYTVAENADYQVRVTDNNGCEGLSKAYPINNVNIYDVEASSRQVSIYPNPANELLYIKSPVAVQFYLTTLDGRVIRSAAQVTSISVKDLPEGMYLLSVFDTEKKLIKIEKVVVGH